MLGWSMMDLAKAADVSISTIKRIEFTLPQPVSGFMVITVRETMEAAGVMFLPDDGNGLGVRIRPAGI